MGMKAEEALGSAKKYTDDTVAGAGAVKGVPCQIQSIVHDDTNSRNEVTFSWVDNSSVTHTEVMYVPDGIKGDKGDQGDKGDTGEQGVQGIQGEKGDQGEQGIQGEQGEDGVSVTSITKVDDYIVFTMSDGNTYKLYFPGGGGSAEDAITIKGIINADTTTTLANPEVVGYAYKIETTKKDVEMSYGSSEGSNSTVEISVSNEDNLTDDQVTTLSNKISSGDPVSIYFKSDDGEESVNVNPIKFSKCGRDNHLNIDIEKEMLNSLGVLDDNYNGYGYWIYKYTYQDGTSEGVPTSIPEEKTSFNLSSINIAMFAEETSAETKAKIKSVELHYVIFNNDEGSIKVTPMLVATYDYDAVNLSCSNLSYSLAQEQETKDMSIMFASATVASVSSIYEIYSSIYVVNSTNLIAKFTCFNGTKTVYVEDSYDREVDSYATTGDTITINVFKNATFYVQYYYHSYSKIMKFVCTYDSDTGYDYNYEVIGYDDLPSSYKDDFNDNGSEIFVGSASEVGTSYIADENWNYLYFSRIPDDSHAVISYEEGGGSGGKTIIVNNNDIVYVSVEGTYNKLVADSIRSALLGVANGVATLNSEGKITESQLPIDDDTASENSLYSSAKIDAITTANKNIYIVGNFELEDGGSFPTKDGLKVGATYIVDGEGTVTDSMDEMQIAAGYPLGNQVSAFISQMISSGKTGTMEFVEDEETKTISGIDDETVTFSDGTSVTFPVDQKVIFVADMQFSATYGNGDWMTLIQHNPLCFIWSKISNAIGVASVNGDTGAVTLNGTNLLADPSYYGSKATIASVMEQIGDTMFSKGLVRATSWSEPEPFETRVPSEYLTKKCLDEKLDKTTNITALWTGTQDEYDAIETKSSTTLYIVKGE